MCGWFLKISDSFFVGLKPGPAFSTPYVVIVTLFCVQ